MSDSRVTTRKTSARHLAASSAARHRTPRTPDRAKRLTLTLSKALTILNLFGESSPEWAAGEVASELKLNLSTVHRLLTTLEAFGYLERTISGRFRLGLKFVNLSYFALSHSTMCHLAMPIAEELASGFGLSATFGVLYQGLAMYLVRVDPNTSSTHTFTGRTVPLHATAIGKALLMSVAPQDLEPIVGSPLYGYTPKTLGSVAELAEEIQAACRNGYAVDQEEFNLNVRGVAVPVSNSSNRHPLAALAISGSKAKLTDDLVPDIVERLTRAAGRLAFALGEPEAYS